MGIRIRQGRSRPCPTSPTTRSRPRSSTASTTAGPSRSSTPTTPTPATLLGHVGPADVRHQGRVGGLHRGGGVPQGVPEPLHQGERLQPHATPSRRRRCRSSSTGPRGARLPPRPHRAQRPPHPLHAALLRGRDAPRRPATRATARASQRPRSPATSGSPPRLSAREGAGSRRRPPAHALGRGVGAPARAESSALMGVRQLEDRIQEAVAEPPAGQHSEAQGPEF